MGKPSPFIRTYASPEEFSRDRKRLEKQGYVVWLGVTEGGRSEAIYVVHDRLYEHSLRWYFGTVFDETRTIVNRYDPYGLLHAGAPQDEYEAELSTILLRFRDAGTKIDAAEIILDELMKSFGGSEPIGGRSACQQVGEEILRVWQAHPRP
ncbi:MAG TPA: hypothetical protein VFA78_08360 [Chloroflexota bacterium]|nr:hypothetical protein [Chloroflexota bacterium]